MTAPEAPVTDSPAQTFTNAILLPVTGEAPWLHGWLSVGADGRITGLGEGSPAADAPRPWRDLGGAFLAPGFVSAHSHIFTGGMRGIAANSPLYEWVSTMGRMTTGAHADDLYWLSLSGALDHLSAGITSVYNFTQSRVVAVFDYEKSVLRAERVHSPEFLTRQIDGVADSGIRFVTAIRLDDEQLPEEEAFAGFDAAMTHLDRIAADQQLGGSVYGAVQWSSSQATAEREYELMRRYGITNQAHFVETAEQLEVQQAKFDWYDRSGVLGEQFAFGHFVHPTDAMVARVADTGSSVVWQPMSNGRLGSGIADIPRLERESIRIGVGVDDQSCTDISDPFENMRTGLVVQRGSYRDAGILSPQRMLQMHTLGSAAAIGVADKVGSLEVGKFADLLVVDPRRPHTGPIWDPVATYVFGCGLRNLREVFVGGRRAFCAGAVDERRIEADEQASARMIASAAKAGITPAVSPG